MPVFRLKSSPEQVILELKEALQLEKAIEIFLKETQVKLTTYHTYSRALERFRKWNCERNFNFLTVGSAEILSYKSYLTEVLEFKPVTISTYLTAVRRFYEFLFAYGKVKINPAKNIKGNKRPQNHSTKYLSKMDLKTLFSFVKSGETELAKRDLMIFKLMLNAGICEMEISELTYGDIFKEGKSYKLYVKTKSEKQKVGISVSEEFYDELINFLGGISEIKEPGKLDFPVIKNLHFIKDTPKNLSIRALRQRVNFYLKETGLKAKGIKAMSFKHTAAFLALERGMSVEEVKSFMRHKTLDTTLIYQRESDKPES
ncbi:tyrosine-type recombinase/integrase [bacterium]|nr:tyrosine-type recombinase/integrase [bacterium]